jgi:hypothetical protein
MCVKCVAEFPRSRGRPPLVPVHGAGELWPNALNRAVGVLGSSGMGWGAMVLPFLSRRSEGAAVHATSVECYNATQRQYDTWPADEVRSGWVVRCLPSTMCDFTSLHFVFITVVLFLCFNLQMDLQKCAELYATRADRLSNAANTPKTIPADE